MSTIRSAPPPQIPPRPASDARAAFFRTVAPPETVARQTTASQPQVAQAPVRTPAPAPAPDRPLRPGSIIDIKV